MKLRNALSLSIAAGILASLSLVPASAATTFASFLFDTGGANVVGNGTWARHRIEDFGDPTARVQVEEGAAVEDDSAAGPGRRAVGSLHAGFRHASQSSCSGRT